MNIAFDIDDTLWKIVPDLSPSAQILSQHRGYQSYKQVPDYDLISVLKWFKSNGANVYVWSAGGTDYAQTIVDKLGLDSYVVVIDKEMRYSGEEKFIDIAFDDEDVELGKVNIKIKREARESY